MIVRGTAEWASVFEPNDLSGKYQVDICKLDSKTVKELESVGINVRKGEGEKSDKGSYITAKAGKFPPKVWDRKKNPMDGSQLIATGTRLCPPGGTANSATGQVRYLADPSHSPGSMRSSRNTPMASMRAS
mgnify:CR=1 FL=1